MIYSLRNNEALSKMILDNIESNGQNIRKYYQRKLPTDPTKDYYYILRDTSPAESLLIEYAFLDSSKDDKNQIKNDWQEWAESVVKAVANYKGYNYTEPNKNTINDVYTVQNGDSLWSIAKRFNVGVNELKTVNNLNSNLISIGQKLVLPGVAPSNQANISYIVQNGDSLWSIANANNTTIDEIVNLNDLSNNTIYVGQILQIPNVSQEEVAIGNENVYIVQRGDTLYSISKKYNTSPSAILASNDLDNSILMVGQILKIPADVESSGINEDVSVDNTYIVQNKDTLYSISKIYNTTVSELKRINNLQSDILTIGQILIIPSTIIEEPLIGASNLYVVQKGDNLWSIATKFNVSINEIRMINNLNTDVLNIGQTLIIP